MLAKADRLDGGGSVEGHVSYNSIKNKWFMQFNKETKEGCHPDIMYLQINPQTLKYSFDNGVNWFSESEIRDKLVDNEPSEFYKNRIKMAIEQAF